MGLELLLILILRAEAASGVAIVLILGLRTPFRRLAGPAMAYRLWALVPLAAAWSLFPALSDYLAGPAVSAPPLRMHTLLSANRAWEANAPLFVALWGAGAAAVFAAFLISEIVFRARAARGLAGPAVVGLAAPRLVVPVDYLERFDPAERMLIRAHERAHIELGHPACNALAAALQILGWFNPLVHLAAGAARIDQELACDAAVLDGRPRLRRPYAEALLKASGPRASPLSCSFAGAERQMRLRLREIMSAEVSLARHLLGFVGVGLAGALCVLLLWTGAPPQGLGSPGRSPFRVSRTVVVSLHSPGRAP